MIETENRGSALINLEKLEKGMKKYLEKSNNVNLFKIESKVVNKY